jgi:hypothetical protein
MESRPYKNPPGYDRQTRPPEGSSHGWIQWKGTEVCMDFWCTCGHHGHVDAEFAYYIRCVECGQVYMANGHIEMVPITAEEAAGEFSVVNSESD